MLQSEIITFYGQARIADISQTKPIGISHYQINTSYINNLRRTVRAKNRANLELTFPAVLRAPNPQDELFFVRQELVVSWAMAAKFQAYFKNLKDVTGPLDLFRKAYLQVHEAVSRLPNNREIRCTIEHTFTESDLATQGGLFYHHDLDTLFKFDDTPFEVDHPYSREGQTAAAQQNAALVRDEHGFVFWIEIIDNQERYGERYVSICNQIYKIVPRHDKNRPDGLYIVSSKPSQGRVASTDLQTRMYDLDNIDKELGIYPTYELAQTHGDIAGNRKRELQEREIEMARERQQWQQEKLRYDREAAEHDRQLKAASSESERFKQSMEDLRAREAHLIKMHEMQSRERYDNRQAERRDASDFVKFLPTILTAISTILMFWKTFKP